MNACLKGLSVPQSELRHTNTPSQAMPRFKKEINSGSKIHAALVKSIFIAFLNKLAFPINGPLWLQSTCGSDNNGCADQLLGHIYLLNKTIELDVSQSFCKAISNHFFHWDVGQLDSLGCNLIADVMVLDVVCQCY